MIKRAVLYARVSSDDRGKDGRNLAGQLELCRDFSIGKGWKIVAELAEDDRGASGASFELPELNRAREMAQAKEFDVLVVRELDRLSRKLAKQLIVEEQLNRSGVEVAYVLAEYEDTPEGRLNKHIRATIAEYEREKINERMVRGRRQVVKNGRIMLHGKKPPYGYRLSEDGKTLIIHEQEAAIIQQIYTWYVVGDETGKRLSSRAIAEKLTAVKVPTWADLRSDYHKKRKRGEWSWRMVIRILKRETYAGRWHYGKRNCFTGEVNSRDHWLTFEVPAILDEDLWQRAQTQRKQNKTESKRNRKREFLVGRRSRCGLCGSSVNGYSVKGGNKYYEYYRCNGYMGNIANVKCDLPSFRANHVDAVVWEWVKSFLENPSALEEGLDSYQDEKEKYCAPLRERLEVIDDLWNDTKLQLDRVLDLYITGDFPKDILVDRKQRLEDTLEALDQERKELSFRLETQKLTEKQIQRIQEFSEVVAEGLGRAEGNFEARRQIIELLDVRVTLTVEDGEKVVYVRCILGDDSLSVDDPTTRSGVPTKSHPHYSAQSHHRPHHTYRLSPWLAKRAWPCQGPCDHHLWHAAAGIQWPLVAETLEPVPIRHSSSHRLVPAA